MANGCEIMKCKYWFKEKCRSPQKTCVCQTQMKELDIPYALSPATIQNNNLWCLWCCDCGLRHIYHFRIVRGKKSKDDKVIVSFDRDDWATIANKQIKYKQKTEKYNGKAIQTPDL